MYTYDRWKRNARFEYYSVNKLLKKKKPPNNIVDFNGIAITYLERLYKTFFDDWTELYYTYISRATRQCTCLINVNNENPYLDSCGIEQSI